jgi:hypothetical protein
VGGAGGMVGAWQNSKLTVDFHESNFVAAANDENQLTLRKGFWFQLSQEDARKATPSGPGNPQALNRFSYVQNNPLRYVDPSGHFRLGIKEAIVFQAAIDFMRHHLQSVLKDRESLREFIDTFFSAAPGLVEVMEGLFSSFVGNIAGAHEEELIRLLDWMYTWVTKFINLVNAGLIPKDSWIAFELLPQGSGCWGCVTVRGNWLRDPGLADPAHEVFPTSIWLWVQLHKNSLEGIPAMSYVRLPERRQVPE